MKSHLPNFLALLLFGLPAYATDWSQPPVGCIEEFVPKNLNIPCPDLSTAANPLVDIPTTWTPEELDFWNVKNRSNLTLCRASEVERRVKTGEQTFSDDVLQVVWMRLNSAAQMDQKISAIYQASLETEIPSQVLFGALKQESLLANLGLTPDGNNYSCGIGQINIQEWCRYMNSLHPVEQMARGWPVNISCEADSLPTTLLSPFYRKVKENHPKMPDYLLTADQFDGISLDQVIGEFPTGHAREQAVRFQAARSFLNYCQDPQLGILAKAHELRHIFDTYVPREMRKSNRYTKGESFSHQCVEPASTKFYPLHTGWLLAVAIYNAGQKQVSLLSHYYGIRSSKKWRSLTPLDLIEGLHWGGKFDPQDQMLHFKSPQRKDLTQTWFKSCIVQRHIARVIQYAALPGIELAKSLEIGGCVKDKVPEYRQTSSGKK